MTEYRVYNKEQAEKLFIILMKFDLEFTLEVREAWDDFNRKSLYYAFYVYSDDLVEALMDTIS